MAITVSIPTILRTHTGGEKSVEASGATVAEVIDDLESRHGGLKARLVKEEKLHRFINVYVNDEDVRFAGGLEAKVNDGDNVTILPAVAGGSARPRGWAGGLPEWTTRRVDSAGRRGEAETSGHVVTAGG